MAANCKSIFFSKDNYEMTKCRMFSIGNGNGQIVAQALFESLKDRNCEYTLAQESLMAYRLIKEAIKSSPVVGEPIDIWTIKDNVVKQKTKEELEELNNLSDDWMNEERRVSEDILSSLD
jgi:20S proteasome alpha/beta subunit